MRRAFAAATIAFAWLSSAGALAFGTISIAGQNAEHERITRHALACPAGGAACFQPRSLDQLAGKSDTFGAIGAPDNPVRGLLFQSSAHCDNGDYLAVPGYPRSAAVARATLESCRAWMQAKFDEAIADAAGLLQNGRIRSAAVLLSPGCSFLGTKGRAKCNVIEDLGLVLHAAQDFYSHSNWADRPNPKQPVGPENPPGLGRAGPAPWIALRGTPAFPAGLMSGCFGGMPEGLFCNGGPGGAAARVKHAVLNKDTGTIDPAIGPGTTTRGEVEGNFRRAVEAAIADSRDKWVLLRERLIAKYGAMNGARMTCAISHDDPVKDC